MDQEKKEELKKLITGAGYNHYDDMMTAKDSLDVLAKSVKNDHLIEPTLFKKLVKFHYEKSMENERRKFNEVDELYIELFGMPKPEKDLFTPDEIKEDPDPINDTIDKDEILDKIAYGLQK